MNRIALVWAVLGCLLSGELMANGSGWKVALIDTGLMRNHPNISSRINEQLCWSRADKRTGDSTDAQTGFVHFDIASTCPSGRTSEFSLRDAATVPRRYTHNFNAIYDWHYFGARHGSNVLEQARRVASRADYIIVNNSYYSASNIGKDSNGQDVSCGYHGPDDSVPDSRRPSDKVSCYIPHNAEKQSSISCNNNNTIFKDLKNRNIAFVASAGNKGANGAVQYPACNPHTISVGATIGNQIAPITSLQGNIDFFADGRGFDYLTGNGLSAATSYAAPIVAAAFAVMKSRKSNATLAEMKHALDVSAFNHIKHRGNFVPVVDKFSAAKAAECLALRTCVYVPPPPGFETVNYSDGGSYGPLYGDDSDGYSFEVDFNNLNVASAASASRTTINDAQVSSKASTTVSSRRDVVLKFTGVMRDSGSRRFRVKINGISRASLSNYYSAGEQRTFTLYINRNQLRSGNNTITIEPTSTRYVWGIKNISTEYTPVVPLTIGTANNNTYGYDRSPRRLTGMRASFDLAKVTNDLALSVTGWDIDRDDETAVYLNGKRTGFLKKGPSSQNNAGDTIVFRKTDLVEGQNMIEFVQRFPGSGWSGYQDEKWAVKNGRAAHVLYVY